jgi:hypothetical protein
MPLTPYRNCLPAPLLTQAPDLWSRLTNPLLVRLECANLAKEHLISRKSEQL